jgi:hypothetical protein
MTVRTAPSIDSNGHTAAEIASGRPCTTQRDLGDDTERASDPTKSRVRSYPADDFRARPPVVMMRAVGEHDCQAAYGLTHGPVADRRGARCAGGDHAAYRRVGAGIDPEVHAGVGESLVQLTMSDAGLHGHVEIVHADAEHAIHPREIDRHSALEAFTWPSSDEPAPNGTTGAPWRAAARTTALTSSVVSGKSDGIWAHSVWMPRLAMTCASSIIHAPRLWCSGRLTTGRAEIGV